MWTVWNRSRERRRTALTRRRRGGRRRCRARRPGAAASTRDAAAWRGRPRGRGGGWRAARPRARARTASSCWSEARVARRRRAGRRATACSGATLASGSAASSASACSSLEPLAALSGVPVNASSRASSASSCRARLSPRRMVRWKRIRTSSSVVRLADGAGADRGAARGDRRCAYGSSAVSSTWRRAPGRPGGSARASATPSRAISSAEVGGASPTASRSPRGHLVEVGDAGRRASRSRTVAPYARSASVDEAADVDAGADRLAGGDELAVDLVGLDRVLGEHRPRALLALGGALHSTSSSSVERAVDLARCRARAARTPPRRRARG